MGTCFSFTKEDIDEQIGRTVPYLPLALKQDDLVVVSGVGSLFNPAPLMDISWYNGRMTHDEYSSYINHINTSVGASMIGQSSTLYFPEEYEGIKEQAARNIVTQINRILESKGIHITYHREADEITYHRKGRRTYKTPTKLYFNFHARINVGHDKTDAIPMAIADLSPPIATTTSSPSASAPPSPVATSQEDLYSQRYKIVAAG